MWKWRHDVLEAVDSHEVDPTRIVPHVSMVFSFAGGGPRPPRFFRNLSSTRPSPSSPASYLIRGSLIRTRGREWAAKDPLLSFFAAISFPREQREAAQLRKHALLNAI